MENRPGGNTGIGAGAVLNAPPDGYTLLFALASNAGLRCTSARPRPTKSFAEFTPIVAIGGNTQCLVVPASLRRSHWPSSSRMQRPARSRC